MQVLETSYKHTRTELNMRSTQSKRQKMMRYTIDSTTFQRYFIKQVTDSNGIHEIVVINLLSIAINTLLLRAVCGGLVGYYAPKIT